MEQTLVILKPDAVQRRLVGEIISRLERKGLYLVQSKVLIPSEDLLKKHYHQLSGKPFFNGLVNFMRSNQVVVMIWEGENAIKVVRDIVGPTDLKHAIPGTIRGDYAIFIGKNLIHASDSIESAKHEISLWFGNEIPEIKHFDKNILYE